MEAGAHSNQSRNAGLVWEICHIFSGGEEALVAVWRPVPPLGSFLRQFNALNPNGFFCFLGYPRDFEPE